MIGLALSGGSVRGAYEVGVYFALKKCHIKIDGFVGTSIGSFNAAMLSARRERQLLKFWRHVNVGKVLSLDDNFVESLKNKNFKGTVKGIKQIITSKGVSTIGLKEVLEELHMENDIRLSKKDFGLVTVRVNPLKVLYLFKEDIPKYKMNDYILGSCYHPVFKQEKIIDGKHYIDGGFYDAMPVNMLLDKGYDLVYAVDLKAIGVKQRIKDKKRVVIISPSHSLGSQFTIETEQIRNNIKMGYYDTLKLIKNLDGKKYIFKKEKDEVYDKMVRSISDYKLKEVKLFFKKKTNKEAIIAVIEYFMLKEKYEYNKIYSVKKVIKRLRKEKKKPYGIYRFLRDLKV